MSSTKFLDNYYRQYDFRYIIINLYQMEVSFIVLANLLDHRYILSAQMAWVLLADPIPKWTCMTPAPQIPVQEVTSLLPLWIWPGLSPQARFEDETNYVTFLHF